MMNLKAYKWAFYGKTSSYSTSTHFKEMLKIIDRRNKFQRIDLELLSFLNKMVYALDSYSWSSGEIKLWNEAMKGGIL